MNAPAHRLLDCQRERLFNLLLYWFDTGRSTRKAAA